MKKSLFKTGFTLIELLVVIAIIAILTGIVTASFGDSRKKARDAKRVSDIAQLQLMLELGFDKCSRYPALIVDTSHDICTGYPIGYFMSSIPTDYGTPYKYYTNGSSPNSRTDYILRAGLELYNPNALSDDIDNIHTTRSPGWYEGDSQVTVGTGANQLNCEDNQNASPPHNYCVRSK